jgi:general secretion pathway protein G
MSTEVTWPHEPGLALRPTLAGRKSYPPRTPSGREVLHVFGLGSADHRMGRGFTLIEMMIVISIVMILTSIAVPIYRTHVLHAREAVLREDLFTIRLSIDQYTQDKVKAPQTLDELVSSGYMRVIPKDPFTDSNQTWEPVMDDSIMQLGQTEPGIVDVHSGSKLTASDGTIYNTW